MFSYVSTNDDDTRPCRAYSLGSKPPENQLANNMEKIRTRAFSVGSKKKTFNRVSTKVFTTCILYIIESYWPLLDDSEFYYHFQQSNLIILSKYSFPSYLKL